MRHAAIRPAVGLPLLCALLSVVLYGAAAGAQTTIAGGDIINQTWTLDRSPYTVQGDIRVPAGTALTIEAGVVVRFTTSDALSAGRVTSLVELVVQGTLAVNGTVALPVTFASTATNTSVNLWYGIIVASTSTSAVIQNAQIMNASVGVTAEAPGSALRLVGGTISRTAYGVMVTAGAAVLDGVTMQNIQEAGVWAMGGAVTVANSRFTTGGTYALAATSAAALTAVNTTVAGFNGGGVVLSGAGASSLTNVTVNACGTYGVFVGNSAAVTVRNSVITNSATYGVYRATGGAGTLSVTYSDVWGNPVNFGSGPLAVPGVGCISANPLYVSATDLQLQPGSVAIDSGNPTGAPDRDLLGALRPLDGDGIDGAQYDMGAYEYVPTTRCGNGLREGAEVCDDGARNGMYGACNATCNGSGPRCGDNTRNGPEECDDANNVDNDACTNACRNARCGDTIVQASVEACDDGNMVDTDACRNSCVAARCGDGVTRVGAEECDDANTVDTDACRNSCTAARCGDGVVQGGVEACDDGASNGSYGFCNAACGGPGARCGDGMRNGPEECDDANNSNGDACLNTCRDARCGDGVTRDGVEECDDANGSNADACTNTCRDARCGDGFVRAGSEQCDDSNNAGNDGCSATCMIEAPADAGMVAVDAGSDAGGDAGSDAGSDAGMTAGDATAGDAATGLDGAVGDAAMGDATAGDAATSDGEVPATDRPDGGGAIGADVGSVADAGAPADAGGADAGGATPNPDAPGCGCRAGGATPPAGPGVALLAVGLLVAVRRRRVR